MQAAIDHLEKAKVFVEALGMEMVPLTEAYTAVELSIDSQLDEAMKQLSESISTNYIDDIEND